MPGRPFEKGHKFAKGGKRAGAGRKPNWFKELCAEELEKNKAAGIQLIGKIYRGEADIEHASVSFGQVVKYTLKPSAQDSIAAGVFLRDSSEGRPAQAVNLGGKVSLDIFDIIRRAEEERGLPSSFDD